MISFADPATSTGRYHRLGGPGVWYGSSQQQACWAELFRHFLDSGVDPFEVRRRVGKVTVRGLAVLDLTDGAVLATLHVADADLVGDDYTISQELAAAALTAGFAGLLAPSAALPGRQTLVVFAAGVAAVVEESSTVPQPPPRLVDLLSVIRPHPDTPRAVRDFVAGLAELGSDAVRRRRR